jgi:predicted ATP-grasp superfamily ATP-dependent carboligase
MIIYNARKNFISKDFKYLAIMIGITTKTMPVEAYWLIGKVERYYAVLRRAYQIVSEELPDLDKEMALQMAVKAVNDIAGLNGLVPILLVFGTFP